MLTAFTDVFGNFARMIEKFQKPYTRAKNIFKGLQSEEKIILGLSGSAIVFGIVAIYLGLR